MLDKRSKNALSDAFGVRNLLIACAGIGIILFALLVVVVNGDSQRAGNEFAESTTEQGQTNLDGRDLDQHDHSSSDGHDHDHVTVGVGESDISMPPGFLSDDNVLDVPQDNIADLQSAHDDHSGHDHAGHDHSGHDHAGHDHAGHDHSAHGHAGHDDESTIELSPQARRNLGLVIQLAKLGSFIKYIDVPGLVTDWPGETHIDVTSPVTGVINSIEIAQGELLSSGSRLFVLRLTHQDLVKTQEEFLTQLGQRDVEDREIDRLAGVAKSGALAGKTLITRKYERDRLQAGIQAASQSLLLHGLTDAQIKGIENDRVLIREVTVDAPEIHHDDSLHHDSIPHRDESNHVHDDHAHDDEGHAHRHSHHVDSEFLVTALDVNRGQSVHAGDRLMRLSDYSRLLIEGHAFQRDSSVLRDAAVANRSVQVVFESNTERPEVLEGLQIMTIGNEIDRETRALPFYVALENQIERSESRGGRKYASWHYKPGQRLRIRIPTDELKDTIVVPASAVAKDGAERYVFAENAGHFDRVSVTVLAYDSLNYAIDPHEDLRPGQPIAIAGADQLLMALQNKSAPAGGSHAHHGHSH